MRRLEPAPHRKVFETYTCVHACVCTEDARRGVILLVLEEQRQPCVSTCTHMHHVLI